MQVRFVLGAASSGKTSRCLSEVSQRLVASGDGQPLIVVAPKQSTYHFERQLLSDPQISGYTRLHILSFERLGWFVLTQLGLPRQDLLDEEGRLMVLRSLLASARNSLALFRASARLTGFAQQLSEALREFQAHQITPEKLRLLAKEGCDSPTLSAKLTDLALLLELYLKYLHRCGLQDSDSLLDAATRALSEASNSSPLRIEHLWVDGFTEFNPQELQLLAALVQKCGTVTVTFCLDHLPTKVTSGILGWSSPSRNFLLMEETLRSVPGVSTTRELLPRLRDRESLELSPLQHLERFWHQPEPYVGESGTIRSLEGSLRVVNCATPESEANFAAREILEFVRAGARFRDVAVLVRDFKGQFEPLQRIFSRYEIPYFMDRRESVAHHPVAELTRSALRTITYDWKRSDWFGALKTGLVEVPEQEIDLLENEALARGWEGSVWRNPLVIKEAPELSATLAAIQNRVVPPFLAMREAMQIVRNQPNGRELAAALRQLWEALKVPAQLEAWSTQAGVDLDSRLPAAVHLTVWQQMEQWLENLELAFAEERLHLKDWLPVIEAGLSNLTVGLIPPALDQVLIGTIDRSRDARARFLIILGLNESKFPAPPKRGVLITESDRVALERLGALKGTAARYQLSRERFLAYIAFTRARERLLLTSAREDAAGSPLNPSSYLTQLAQLFPSLKIETWTDLIPWQGALHASELVQPLLTILDRDGLCEGQEGGHPLLTLAKSPKLERLVHQLRSSSCAKINEAPIHPDLVLRLYGPTLRTSVSRLEQFAACPFKYFVNSGLKAEDRRLFELDVKEQGTFLHNLLSEFHKELSAENLRWRDVTPEQARFRIEALALRMAGAYRDGLLHSTEQSRFQVRVLTSTMQDFLETVIGWMRGQYDFDPAHVELPFGEPGTPEWEVNLAGGRALKLYGRIDRVDLCRDARTGETLCVVVDYKSGQKQLDTVLIVNGLQLQLLTYLNVLCKSDTRSREAFGAALTPAGVFYVNLRGRYGSELNRDEALADATQSRRKAYQHLGRFDAAALRKLDNRPNAVVGDQFSYRVNRDRSIRRSPKDPMPSPQFAKLLETTEEVLRTMGDAIYAGEVQIAPFRYRGATACDQCDYASVCRMDPWAQSYRMLHASPVDPSSSEPNPSDILHLTALTLPDAH